MEAKPRESDFSRAQKVISRRWRRFAASQRRKEGKTLVRVVAPRTSLQPRLIGTFTRPAWSQGILLRYSLREAAHYAEVWMNADDSFAVMVGNFSMTLPQFLPVPNAPANQQTYFPAPSLRVFQHLCSRSFTSRLSFRCGSSAKAKGDEQSEDSHFASTHFLGVADGVGGWRQFGFDSGAFARELLQACQSQEASLWRAHLQTSHCTGNVLKSVAKFALQRVTAQGGSTLLLASLMENSMRLMSLGDSQAMLVRFEDGEGKCVVRTKPLQHRFNTPFQLSKTDLSHLREKRKRTVIADSPSVADCYEVHVKPGDLLIMASDGLWDNLFESEILSLLCPDSSAEELAHQLLQSAYIKSTGKSATPFELEATLAYGPHAWSGGKRDDITVIAAWIHSEPVLK